MHNTSNERFFSFITTVVKQKYKVGNPDKKRKLSGMISELFWEKSGIFKVSEPETDIGESGRYRHECAYA